MEVISHIDSRVAAIAGQLLAAKTALATTIQDYREIGANTVPALTQAEEVLCRALSELGSALVYEHKV